MDRADITVYIVYEALLLHCCSDFDETRRILEMLDLLSTCRAFRLWKCSALLHKQMFQVHWLSCLCHTHSPTASSNKLVPSDSRRGGRIRAEPHPKPAFSVYTNPTFMLITFMMIKRPRWWEGRGRTTLRHRCQQTHTHTHRLTLSLCWSQLSQLDKLW